MSTNKEKLKEIKESGKILSRSYHTEILIIIAKELIKMNEYFERVEYDKNHQPGRVI